MTLAINRERLAAQLIEDEDLRLKPYRCTEGRLTIGVGRNLDDKGLTKAEALYLLANDIDDSVTAASAVVGADVFGSLDAVRQEVLVNMALNLGQARLAGFKQMVAAVRSRQFVVAAKQMLESKWAVQVGERAQRLADAMRTGSFGP